MKLIPRYVFGSGIIYIFSQTRQEACHFIDIQEHNSPVYKENRPQTVLIRAYLSNSFMKIYRRRGMLFIREWARMRIRGL
jgi:hypothetical protein